MQSSSERERRNMKGTHTQITSQFQDFNIKLELNGETYLIVSDDLGVQNPHILTRTYKKGMIIYSNKISYRDILNEPDFDRKFSDLLKSEQQRAVGTLKNEIKADDQPATQKRTYKEYITGLEALLSRNMQEEALELLTEAMEHYPTNPILLSYHGYIEARVNKHYSDGIKICRQSFKMLKKQMPLVEGFYLPTLYLNLGKTHLSASNKKDAYFSFQRGLEIDEKHQDLLSELNKLGRRRKPTFPFLKRSNPLNKYVGMLTYELQKMR